MQHELSKRRMMAAIPEADVVITNPTHYAVALKYDQKKKGAPVVVARGKDFVALQIRSIAEKNKVSVLEIPPLARAVYFATKLDQEIPFGLYVAVAQVLAYVYQLKTNKNGRGKKPMPLGDIDIPPEFRQS
jgi:flagellar biosynthetic protein FlhB